MLATITGASVHSISFFNHHAQGTVELVSSTDTLAAIITKAQNKKCSDRVSQSFQYKLQLPKQILHVLC